MVGRTLSLLLRIFSIFVIYLGVLRAASLLHGTPADAQSSLLMAKQLLTLVKYILASLLSTGYQPAALHSQLL